MKYIKTYEEKGNFYSADYVWSNGRKKKYKPEELKTKFKIGDYVLWTTDFNNDKICGKVININKTKTLNLYFLELIDPGGTYYQIEQNAWASEHKLRLLTEEEKKELELRVAAKKYNL